MKIKIHVTKEIYRKAMNCHSCDPQHCAIAEAVREIAPNAGIGSWTMIWDADEIGGKEVYLPSWVGDMILAFDMALPEARLNLPEFSFEVDFPDEMVEKIGINELRDILEKSETLELA